MEAGQHPPASPINAPHPDDDPAAFFDDVPGAGPEPTLDEARPIPVDEPPLDLADEREGVFANLAASRDRAAVALAAQPQPREALAADPPPVAEAAQPSQEPASAPAKAAEPPPHPPAPAAPAGAVATPRPRAARGTVEPPRQYTVLREVELTPPVLTALLEKVGKDGKAITAYVALEDAAPGRSPKQVGKDVFKAHYKRLGVGLAGQPALILFAIAHSSWQRMVLSIKPKVIDDNIEIEGDDD